MSSTDSVRQPFRSEGSYSALVQTVRSQGLLHRRPLFYFAVATALLGALGSIVICLAVLRDSWWTLLLAPVLAAVSGQIAFFAHDAAHHQIAQGGRATALLALVPGNLLIGMSYGWWLAKHNAHHAHPNDLTSDPDVAAGVFVFDAAQAGGRTGPAGWFTRHQAVLFFPMLTLEAVNLRVSSARALARPGLRYRRLEVVLFLSHFALYVGLLVGTMTWSQGLVFLAVHQALFGVYLGSSFAPAHKGMPALTSAQAADPCCARCSPPATFAAGPPSTSRSVGSTCRSSITCSPA